MGGPPQGRGGRRRGRRQDHSRGSLPPLPAYRGRVPRLAARLCRPWSARPARHPPAAVSHCAIPSSSAAAPLIASSADLIPSSAVLTPGSADLFLCSAVARKKRGFAVPIGAPDPHTLSRALSRRPAVMRETNRRLVRAHRNRGVAQRTPPWWAQPPQKTVGALHAVLCHRAPHP